MNSDRLRDGYTSQVSGASVLAVGMEFGFKNEGGYFSSSKTDRARLNALNAPFFAGGTNGLKFLDTWSKEVDTIKNYVHAEPSGAGAKVNELYNNEAYRPNWNDSN